MQKATIKVKSLPDLGKAFKQIQIQADLEKVSTDTMYGTIIHWAIKNKPMNAVCKLILDQYVQSKEEVLKVIHQETIDLIKAM